MNDQELQPWSSLTAAEQIELRADYQKELEHQPLTCSLDEKVERFSSWLAHRGISFSSEDLRGRRSN
ncbi:MAG: hypothetical protein KDJ19_04980 [Hyphomicrobiaceae bacterium]|nr:hypothetical protein [Hyphomicrobiaceae bacterium]MCC0024168.1 hypothetical protein [Hyphomicrobiaceae bacterium]